MCNHEPKCPSASASDRCAAHVVSAHPEQGWCLLCNGVVLFDDGGLILPNGCVCAAWELPGSLIPRDIATAC